MTRTEGRPKRKPGRVAGPETVKATILLEPDLLDWAKATPEGLSAMTRRLLGRERQEQEGASAYAALEKPKGGTRARRRSSRPAGTGE